MKNSACVIGLLLTVLLACSSLGPGLSFESNWSQSPDRRWVGADFWANRLQDWSVESGRLLCSELTGRKPFRTVHLLTHALGTLPGDLSMSVETGLITPTDSMPGDAATGFLIGAGRDLDYRAAALIHHSTGSGAGFFAGIDGSGRLFVRDMEEDEHFLAYGGTRVAVLTSVLLTCRLEPLGEAYRLILEAKTGKRDSIISELTIEGLPNKYISGSLALISHPGSGAPTRFWYRHWNVSGRKVVHHPERNCGPVLSTQYTVSRDMLKLTAQFMPIGPEDVRMANLEIDGEQVARAFIDPDALTATFRVEDWDASMDVAYRIVYDFYGQPVGYEGMIRKDPVDAEEFVIAAFTGNHNVARPKGKWAGVDGGTFDWTESMFFPHTDLTGHVAEHRPDLLFFSGDQVYEGASPTYADRKQPRLDYLYKWYLWCWAYGDMCREIPSVILPDDHDVYHGNLWGAGGKATPPGLRGAAAQDAGGYKMPAKFVSMVERTQTSHMPDPPDAAPVAQGIGVYYCDLLWGGVSFAVLEDRKFKSAPGPLLPKARVWNGWKQNMDFDLRLKGDVPDAVLLGDRQLNFIEHWAADWSGGAWMKVALSQTIFANVATLPQGSKNGSIIPSLPILAVGDYPKNDVPVQDMDSNGWPQTGRNKALRALRKGFALHVAGDQHLGSTIQYGVDDWHDAGYALCVPSVANFWPRRWFPKEGGHDRKTDAPRYTGDFEDGFGNKMTVHAVSNPYQSGRSPSVLYDLATGYGIVRLNRKDRTFSMANWPRYASPKTEQPYPGWPVKAHYLENYGRKPLGHLAEIVVSGMTDPVVQVVHEASGEIIYTLRIQGQSFKPPVFAAGTYTIRVGDEKRKEFTDLEIDDKAASVEVVF
ncbi:twin-arginine translocation pathway signal protein [bacterium]|nr:twin-arginine translocation pathway signal protein [bacterium]